MGVLVSPTDRRMMENRMDAVRGSMDRDRDILETVGADFLQHLRQRVRDLGVPHIGVFVIGAVEVKIQPDATEPAFGIQLVFPGHHNARRRSASCEALHQQETDNQSAKEAEQGETIMMVRGQIPVLCR